jgi:predicted amidohydrolase YtcJ
MCLLVLILSWAQQATPSARAPADLIVEGKVFTADEQHPWAEAVAVSAERIAAVGSREEVSAWRGERTRVISAGKGVVVPGFNDAHCHFTVAFGVEQEVDLTSATSLAEILALVKAYAEAHPADEVIGGGYWDLADIPDETYPTAAMLDSAVADRPVLLWSDGPHGLWVNSAALKKANIDERTSAPPGTVFVRDEQGAPSGVFLGRGLFGLFRFSPLPDLEAVHANVRRGFDEARRLGVTSVHESVSPLLLPYLDELADSGELTLRFHVWGSLIAGPFGGGPDQHLSLAKAHGRADWITFGTLKGGVDGMPGLRTAALLAPYADAPGTEGLVLVDPEQLLAAVKSAHDKGLRVALHATGDRAVHIALGAFQAAGREGIHDRIEHAFLVAPEDVARLGKSGVIVSVQPGFLPVDLAKRRFYERRVGPERIGETMPLRSLLDAGAVLAFGTDFSLTPLDPLVGIYAATARRTLTGEPADGWIPKQRLTIQEAVRAYTYGSACAEGAEKRKGTLAPGMLADLVVLTGDIFALEPAQLLETRVAYTLVGGRVVYGD